MPHDTDALGDALHAVETAGGRSSSAYAKTLSRNRAAALMAPLIFADDTVQVEDANVILVDLQMTDLAGNAVAAAVTCRAEILDANGELEVDTAFHLGKGASGTELSTTDKPALLFTTTAAGVAQLEVTDVVGASGATKLIRIIPIGAGVYVGSESLVSVTFD